MQLHSHIHFYVQDIHDWPLGMDALVLYQFIVSMNGELRQYACDVHRGDANPDMTEEESKYWNNVYELLLQAGSLEVRDWCWFPLSNKDITDSIGFKTHKITRLIAKLVEHKIICTKRKGLPPTRWIKIRSSLTKGGE